ncbi:hypothetical protein CEXT_95641 [Caerostris extrusa]|uniref:Uncharacterized protein n=1 Tax=Caerostris extrusa TaxID=172846 RepID=A0AAV4RGU4_CAEEX|nr:hypothetical protein CEXT_95641 [Caerostris extrusa]
MSGGVSLWRCLCGIYYSLGFGATDPLKKNRVIKVMDIAALPQIFQTCRITKGYFYPCVTARGTFWGRAVPFSSPTTLKHDITPNLAHTGGLTTSHCQGPHLGEEGICGKISVLFCLRHVTALNKYREL